MTSKVNVDWSKFVSSASNLSSASKQVGMQVSSLKGTKVPSLSTLKGDSNVNAAIAKLVEVLNRESVWINTLSTDVSTKKDQLKKFDSVKDKTKKKLKKIKLNSKLSDKQKLNKYKKEYANLVFLVGAKNAKKYMNKIGAKVKFSNNSTSIIGLKKKRTSKAINTSKASDTAAKVVTVVRSTVKKSDNSKKKKVSKMVTKADTSDKVSKKNTTLSSLKKALKNALKSGDLSVAANIYGLLYTAVGAKKAAAYLKGLGYTTTMTNGTLKITKTPVKTPTPENKPGTGDDDTEKPATGDTDTPKTPADDIVPNDDDDASGDDTQTLDSGTDNQGSDEAVATPVGDSSEQSNNSSSNQTTYSSGNDNSEVTNTSNEVSSDTEIDVDSDSDSDTSNLINGEDVPESDELPEEDTSSDDKSSNNVVSIDSDDETTSKKSNGLGVAIPIGLGVAATGAAAVAGVRYVKNRHNSSEEYDESYDDENNDLSSDTGSYTDTAEYGDNSSYTNDDYLGPAGSNYTDVDVDNTDTSLESNPVESTDYIDPDDLEEENSNDDFSDDSVLKELDSNYKG